MSEIRRPLHAPLAGLVLAGLPLWAGCGDLEGGGGKVTTAPEAHDLKGEHATYPAGGPDSPEYKKYLAKKKAAEKKSATP